MEKDLPDDSFFCLMNEELQVMAILTITNLSLSLCTKTLESYPRFH